MESHVSARDLENLTDATRTLVAPRLLHRRRVALRGYPPVESGADWDEQPARRNGLLISIGDVEKTFLGQDRGVYTPGDSEPSGRGGDDMKLALDAVLGY
jgi:hypothetical protein